MKISCAQFLLLIVFAGVSYARDSSAQINLDKRIDLVAHSEPIAKVLKRLEKVTNLKFVYSLNRVNVDQKAMVDAENATLKDVLNELLVTHGIGYEVINDRVVLSPLPPSELLSGKVERSMPVRFERPAAEISGTVTDEKGEALAGVTVHVKGTNIGTVTNGTGTFRLQPLTDHDTLVFSYIGYTSEEVAIAGRKVVNVRLSAASSGLNEVVVVGYGNQAQKDVTSSVTTIQGAKVANIPAASFDLRLQGQAPGVDVKQATGFPGAGPVIRIRGSGSIGAGNDPLYVVDGFPITYSYSKYANPLSAIDPDDIESITVLKDAASTAIYGSRGANGVVLITTKKGKAGQSALSVNAYYGLQFVESRNHLQMMSAEDLANFRVQARQDLAAANGTTFDPSTIPADYKNPAALGKGTDWFDALTRVAPIQNYNVTYTSGTEKLRAAVSAGYFQQQGIVLNTQYTRYSIRANLDFNPAKWVTVGLNVAPTFQKRNNAETEGHFNNGILTMGYLSSPLTPVKQPDGSYTPHVTSTDLFDNANPVNMIVNSDRTSHVTQLLSNAYLDISPISHLHLKTTFNAEIQNTSNYNYVPSFVGGFRAPPPQPANGNFGSAYEINWLNENTLNYSRTFGPHDLSLLLGYTVQKDHYDYNQTNGSNYPNDDLHDVGAATVVTASTDIEEWTMISYLGRLNYNYKDKYLVSAALRSDGSSRFAPGNKWSLFPSVSAGWRIFDEPFFPQQGVISDLKIRASYGVAGNNNIGNYRYIPTIGSSNYQFDGNFVSGTALSSLANNQLSWELSRQTDVGLDAAFFSGRVTLTVDYYRKHTQDMLQSIAIPSSSGFSSAYTNLGNVENHGWEFAVHSQNMDATVNWQTDVNLSLNRNKVLKLGGGITQIFSGEVTSSVTEVGQPIGMFYGYKFMGIFQNQEQIDNYPHQAGTLPGNVQYEDVNGDGQITSADMTLLGDPTPRFTWGMTNTVSYGKFDLRVIIDGSQGLKVMDVYKRFADNLDGVFNVEEAVKNRWRSASDPGNGQYASTTGNTPLAREVNSRWVRNASYLCVRNVSVGYTFHEKFVSRARVYLSGQNLLWLTPYKGSDPDIEYNADNALAPNVNYTGYPTATMITGGIDFTF